MKCAILKNRKGITLLELVIAVGICAIVVVVATTVLSTGIKTYNSEFNNTVDQQGLRDAMIQISRQARNPANTVSITGTKVLTVNSLNYSVSSGSLMYNSAIVAKGISAISADYTDSTHKVIQVDLTSAHGNTLSTQIQIG